MSRIRVLIVDDSSFIRKSLCRIFESDPAIEIAGLASNGKEAVQKVTRLNPDVVTMDIMMPEMDGIEALKVIMANKPTPVLMLSQYTREGTELTLNALELGAMDFVDKSSTGLMDFFGLAREIISKVKAISGSRPLKIDASPSTPREYKSKDLTDMVAIGTSTGGPSALQMILPKFPKDISFGILIVQHMPHGFTGPLARRLNSICDIRVKEADGRDKVEPGLAIIAPSGLHMTAKLIARTNGRVKSRIYLGVEPLDTIHKPSVDVLFRSVAEIYGDRSIGVILTGMGSDGVKGIKAIKEKGGRTLAQDEKTSAIFGMPKVAIESGVIDKIVPITSMADEIMKSV
ncbi:MAG: chemotaxis response regulator protein-glutamate methylesterase [Nitrospirota bacterium]